MFGLKFRFEDNTKAVEKRAKDVGKMTISRAAGRVRKTAQKSIEPAPKVGKVKRTKKGQKKPRRRTIPSRPGTPVHTRSGQARRAIQYAAETDNAFIGPVYSKMGTSMEAHEHGGQYKGENYPERSVMGPALTKESAQFAADFAGVI